SLFVHLGLVYGLYHARFPIKILKTGASVQDIVIGPSLTPPPPKIVGPARARVPGSGIPQESLQRRPGPAGGSGSRPARAAASQPSPPPGILPPQPAAPSGPVPAGATDSGVQAFSAKFKESLASRFKSGRESDLSITLSPGGGKPGPAAPAGKTRLPNFYDYFPGPPDGKGGGYGTGNGRAGDAGTGDGQRVGLSIPLKGYDLSPWAQKVLEIFVRNWSLPAVFRLPDKTAVRIILVIAKNGELSSLEVVEGTVLDVLDQAAVDAIRSSLPLPALPADFPGDFLEAHVEFSYHD
ncbi:MAG: TonB C-terminal domain-containing protein, partial [Acidobacteriota bacterium]